MIRSLRLLDSLHLIQRFMSHLLRMYSFLGPLPVFGPDLAHLSHWV